MGQCGPVNPCNQCRPMYEDNPDWTPDEANPGSYRVTKPQDRTKRLVSGVTVAALRGEDRLPVPYTSKRDVRRRRQAKKRRRS